MRMQRRLLASCAPLVLSMNQPHIAGHRVERAFLLAQQKMQALCQHMRPRWSMLERLRLITNEPWEGSFNTSDLITLMSASLTLLRCLARGYLQGVTMLCQK